MTEGNFVDYIKIYASSGKGGRGSAHLHRETFVAKGGPDGGDGGRGGHVIVRGDKSMWTLFHLKFKRHFRAEHGGDGGKLISLQIEFERLLFLFSGSGLTKLYALYASLFFPSFFGFSGSPKS